MAIAPMHRLRRRTALRRGGYLSAAVLAFGCSSADPAPYPDREEDRRDVPEQMVVALPTAIEVPPPPASVPAAPAPTPDSAVDTPSETGPRMLPEGTVLTVALPSDICTNTRVVGNEVRATLVTTTSSIAASDPAIGSAIVFTLSTLQAGTGVGSNPEIVLSPVAIEISGQRIALAASPLTPPIERTRSTSRREQASQVVAGALLGAIAGKLSGESRGAERGAIAGATAGVASAAVTTTYDGCAVVAVPLQIRVLAAVPLP